ncbi:MAG: hypothetical protein J2P28_24140 [Actinobacteria bacterium]|nr:hypothetical protein [Actinomycetota bacterium]MBO0838583.1 hypothetical protein [Actinomycetota bacterium]
MSSQSVSGGSKRSLSVILFIIGLIAVIVGILWFAGVAPSFLNAGSHVKNSGGSHLYRGAAAVVVGLILGGAGWFTRKR